MPGASARGWGCHLMTPSITAGEDSVTARGEGGWPHHWALLSCCSSCFSGGHLRFLDPAVPH